MRTLFCVLMAAGLPACIWVTDDDLDERFTVLTDADGDGFQDQLHGGNDCDDGDPTVHPAADEICNGVDDDCSGIVDDDLLAPWYPDGDGDGFGDDGGMTLTCAPEQGWVEDGDDCDDGDATVSPGADELCNGVDDDCDDETDEDDAVDAAVYYLDGDGDGFGDVTQFVEACVMPSDYVEDASDCDDGDAGINPDADELCNGVDDDCDEDVDEDDALDAAIWYGDGDGDGYGDPDSTTSACSQPSGYVDDATDCDDGDPAVFPGGLEHLGDSDDGDCDGDPEAFSFALHDTRSAQDLEGPRLAQGGGSVYLAWAAEELDDGGTIYDAVAVSVFDDEDPLGAELDFWSTGQGSDQAQLNRFDLVANDTLWVTGSSWVDISDRSIRLDAVNPGTGGHGSYDSSFAWPVGFDQLQLGLSSVGNVTAVGCGDSGAGIQALQISAAGVVAGTASPVAEDEGLDSLDDHDTCEYDHLAYVFYMGSTARQRLDYYELSGGQIVADHSSSYTWIIKDIEVSTAHGWRVTSLVDLSSSNGFYFSRSDTSGGTAIEEWDTTANPVEDLDVSVSPAGIPYACAINNRGDAMLLWNDVDAAVPALRGIDLIASELAAIDECAIVVTADSVAWIALRSGDDVATAVVGVP